MYESSYPKTFVTDLPTAPSNYRWWQQGKPRMPENGKYLFCEQCVGIQNLQQLVHDDWKNNIDYEVSHSKQKRQIGVLLAGLAGFVIRPAVSRLTKDLFGDDDAIDKKLTQVCLLLSLYSHFVSIQALILAQLLLVCTHLLPPARK